METKTKILGKFVIEPEDVKKGMVEDKPFIQNNGDGTFSVSNGSIGFKFCLSDRDFIDLVTDRNQRRIVFVEEED